MGQYCSVFAKTIAVLAMYVGFPITQGFLCYFQYMRTCLINYNHFCSYSKPWKFNLPHIISIPSKS